MYLGCQAEHMVEQSVEILSRKLPTPRWYIGAKAINWLFNSYILVIHLRSHRKCRKGKFDLDQNIEDSTAENEGAAKGACNYHSSLPLIWKIVMLIHGIPVCCLIWTGRWSKDLKPTPPMEKPAYPSPRKLSSLTFCYLVSDLFDGSHCGTGQLVTFPSVIDKCTICYSFFDLLLWQVDNFWNKQLQTPVRMAQAHFGWVPWNANQSCYKANRREEKYHYEPMETQREARENACNRVAGSFNFTSDWLSG